MTATRPVLLPVPRFLPLSIQAPWRADRRLPVALLLRPAILPDSPHPSGDPAARCRSTVPTAPDKSFLRFATHSLCFPTTDREDWCSLNRSESVPEPPPPLKYPRRSRQTGKLFFSPCACVFPLSFIRFGNSVLHSTISLSFCQVFRLKSFFLFLKPSSLFLKKPLTNAFLSCKIECQKSAAL